MVEELEDEEDGLDDVRHRNSHTAFCGSSQCFRRQASVAMRLGLHGRLQEGDRQVLATLDAKKSFVPNDLTSIGLVHSVEP